MSNKFRKSRALVYERIDPFHSFFFLTCTYNQLCMHIKSILKAQFEPSYRTQIFCSWFARWVPALKLKVCTVPVLEPKNHWVHPLGAKLAEEQRN